MGLSKNCDSISNREQQTWWCRHPHRWFSTWGDRPGTYPVVKHSIGWEMMGKSMGIHGKNMDFPASHVWNHPKPWVFGFHTQRWAHGFLMIRLPTLLIMLLNLIFGWWTPLLIKLKFVWVKCRLLLGEIKQGSLVKFKWSCYLLCLSQISSCCYGKSPFVMGKFTINCNFQ